LATVLARSEPRNLNAGETPLRRSSHTSTVPASPSGHSQSTGHSVTRRRRRRRRAAAALFFSSHFQFSLVGRRRRRETASPVNGPLKGYPSSFINSVLCVSSPPPLLDTTTTTTTSPNGITARDRGRTHVSRRRSN